MIRWFLLTVFVSLLAAVSPRERIGKRIDRATGHIITMFVYD